MKASEEHSVSLICLRQPSAAELCAVESGGVVPAEQRYCWDVASSSLGPGPESAVKPA